MADDTSRALGAKSGTTVTIDGKECQIRPLTIAELGELERDCLKRYKRQYLTTFSDNADLLPNGQNLVKEKLEEVAKWDVSDLPPKMVYDPTKLIAKKSLKDWLVENYDLSDEDDGVKLTKEKLKDRIRIYAALALDSGTLQDATYESLVGDAPKKTKVGYVNWWITATFDGMISMIYTCFRDSGFTRDQIVKAIGDNPALLNEASRQIEELSAPDAGNG